MHTKTLRHTLPLVVTVLVAALALSACGNKGPLVLPDKSAAPASDHSATSPPADSSSASPVR